jgi:hypothetical protein
LWVPVLLRLSRSTTRHCRQPFANFLRRSRSFHARHCKVHNYQVRAQFRGLRDRLFPFDGVATNLPTRIGPQ